jgi:hypothetical protein
MSSHESNADRRRADTERSERLEYDMREGFVKVTFTRATARALYYAAFDVVHGRTREHDPHDLERLSVALARLGDGGFPLEQVE